MMVLSKMNPPLRVLYCALSFFVTSSLLPYTTSTSHQAHGGSNNVDLLDALNRVLLMTKTTRDGPRLSEKILQQQHPYQHYLNNVHRTLQEQEDLPFEGDGTQEVFIPSRQCGETFATVTKEDVVAFVDLWFNVLLQAGGGGDGDGDAGGDNGGNNSNAAVELAKQALTSFIQYGFKVMKVCMSCQEAIDLVDVQQVNISAYCSEDTYGYDATHSALVMIPTNNDGDGTILEGSLRGFGNARSTVHLFKDAPSETWPLGKFGEYILQSANDNASAFEVYRLMIDYLLPVIATSAGAVSYAPDSIGFGESYLYNRTYLHPTWYQQSFALSFLATQEAVRTESHGCTELLDITSVYGFSEGGYAAFWGALALKDLGVRILEQYSTGAPLQPAITMGHIFDTYEKDGYDPVTLRFLKRLVALTGFVYSIDTPGILNTGFEKMLSEEYMEEGNVTKNIIEWFLPQNTIGSSYDSYLPEDMTEIINPDLIEIFAAARNDGVLNPCLDHVNENTINLCHGFEASDTLFAMLFEVDYKMTICHSPDDNWVTIKNVPPMPFPNTNVTLYQPIFPDLAPQGDHGTSQFYCQIGMLATFQFGDDRPNIVSPLRDPSTCNPPKEEETIPTPAPDGESADDGDAPPREPESSAVNILGGIGTMLLLAALTAVIAC